MAAVLFKIGVTDGWGLALSHLIGKFKGGGNALSDSVRYSRETPLGSPYRLKKLRERTKADRCDWRTSNGRFGCYERLQEAGFCER